VELWLPGSQQEFCCWLFPAQNFILPRIFCNYDHSECNVHSFVFVWFWKRTKKFKTRFHDQFFEENVSICSAHGTVGKGDKQLAETLVRGYVCLIITIQLLRTVCFPVLIKISCFSLGTSQLVATVVFHTEMPRKKTFGCINKITLTKI